MYSFRSFTLIELLIVIAIIAVLSVVVILALNPAELLKQARDSTRLSDINAINKALSLYQVDNPSASFGSASTTYISYPEPVSATSTCTGTGTGLSTSTLPSGWNYQCTASSSYQKANGTGWIPVNLASITGGSPLPNLPKDLVNTTSSGEYYTYTSVGGQWELTTSVESARFGLGGGGDKTGKDGGDDGYLYEVGSNLKLTPYLIHNTSTLIALNPAVVKILVAEYMDCGQGVLSQFTSLGFTNVTIATSVASVSDVAAYSPDIVVGSNGCWSIAKTTLFNGLYNNGYHIYTEGNDTSANVILPIVSAISVAPGTPSGTITPFASHPINQNWTTTPNSGTDGRYGITATLPNGIVLGKDGSLGYFEALYLEEAGKGRWFHYQPVFAPDNVLARNALFYLAR